MRCVRIGYGTVAPLHESKLQEIGVETIGIIDNDPIKQAKAASNHVCVFNHYENAYVSKPDFWDICTPTESHVDVIRNIIKVDPLARIILEKSACLNSQIDELRDLLKDFKGKIVVNENYLSSKVTALVKQLAFDIAKMVPDTISIEMTKNRSEDFKKGRYIEKDGALMYEGPHMLTNLLGLGKEFFHGEVLNASFTDGNVPGMSVESMKKQGSADITYRTSEGVIVNIYTSMMGDIRNKISEEIPEKIEDSAFRHRVLIVEGFNPSKNRIKIIGFYEPIKDLPRSVGKVITYINGKHAGTICPIQDDIMGVHLKRCVEYLNGKTENPSPLEDAMDIVHTLHQYIKE